MQIRCIRHFSQYKPGDTETVPDGAAFDPFHWEPAADPVPDPEPAAPAAGLGPELAPLAADVAAGYRGVQFPHVAPKEM